MNTRRRMIGVVTSNKMDKTAIVEVTRTYRHQLYKKVVHERKRYMAHDELECQIGDRVQIVESQPISRHKHWVIEEILRHDIAAGEPDIEDVELRDLEPQEPEPEEPEPEEPEPEEPESEMEAEA
jgi:small subunit ribosomal protein S17